MKKNIEKAYFWPRWFYLSLNQAERKKITTKTLNNLCNANLCLWRALNLYDDFLDGEGRPSDLPTANEYYRQFLEIYYRLNLSANFYKIFNKVLSNLDAANRAEVSASKLKIKNSRIYIPSHLPSFSDLSSLSQKSLALGLGPVALFDIIGDSKKPQRIKVTLKFFRYALAAKQLSDDSCDWLDDIFAKSITPANALILKAAKKKGLILNYKKNPKIFYLLFIEEAALKITEGISDLCKNARREGLKIGLNYRSTLIKELLGPMEEAVKKAREASNI